MKIALIDDAAMNLTLMQHLLARIPSTEAISFQSALEGLAWVLRGEADLVIVDYMMPSLNGVDLVRRLRQEKPLALLPILMVTANQDMDVRYRALEAGVTDFLTKPIDVHEFSARVRNMLALRRSQVELSDRAQWLDKEVRLATANLRASEREMIMRLTRAADYRDPETGAHIQRMAAYSQLIARALGWSEEAQELILTAAPMHDVGKVGIPDHILLKPGRLDAEELIIMRTHPALGHQILAGSSFPVLQLAAEIALTHHEKFDGSGYPHGLSGHDIPESGRIVAVADVFDALMSPRPYKKPWSLESAVAYLRDESGKHFDPECVNAFLDHLDQVLEIQRICADETVH